MAKKLAEALVDKRVVNRQIDRGLLTKEEYKEYMDSLADESKNADVCKVFTEDENLLTFSSVETH